MFWRNDFSLSLFGWRDVGENDDLAMVVAMIKKVHCTFTFSYNDSWDKKVLRISKFVWFDERNYSVLKYALSFILNNGERERAPIKKYTLSDSSFHKMMFLSYHAYSRERKKWVACWQNWAEKMDENGTILAKFISWWDVIRTETFSFAS